MSFKLTSATSTTKWVLKKNGAMPMDHWGKKLLSDYNSLSNKTQSRMSKLNYLRNALMPQINFHAHLTFLKFNFMRTESKEEETMDPRSRETNLWVQWKEIINESWVAGLEGDRFKLEQKVWRTCLGRKFFPFNN